MYVYIRSEPGLYTVGFYRPDGKWVAESDHSTRDEAAARVSYLNGQAGSPRPELMTMHRPEWIDTNRPNQDLPTDMRNTFAKAGNSIMKKPQG